MRQPCDDGFRNAPEELDYDGGGTESWKDLNGLRPASKYLRDAQILTKFGDGIVTHAPAVMANWSRRAEWCGTRLSRKNVVC